MTFKSSLDVKAPASASTFLSLSRGATFATLRIRFWNAAMSCSHRPGVSVEDKWEKLAGLDFRSWQQRRTQL